MKKVNVFDTNVQEALGFACNYTLPMFMLQR